MLHIGEGNNPWQIQNSSYTGYTILVMNFYIALHSTKFSDISGFENQALLFFLEKVYCIFDSF